MRILWFILIILFFPVVSWCQLINNYDTCRTSVYFQYIGNTNNETKTIKARTVQDNGMVSAGYIKQAGSQNALIFKQDMNGKVIWQKEYGDPSYDEQITDWRELTDKKLLVAGIAKNRTSAESHFFLMLLTDNGNLVWQKAFKDAATPTQITKALIYPDMSGKYFFAAETDSSIIYGMTDNTGQLNWQRSLSVKPGSKLVAATSGVSNLLFVTSLIDSGYHVVNFFHVDYVTIGNPQLIRHSLKLGGPHQNAHYILHDYEQYESYTYFTAIRSINGGPYELIRINLGVGYVRNLLEKIVTPGISIDSTTISSINMYGDMISFTSGAKSRRINAVSLSLGINYPTETIWSSSFQLPDSVSLLGNTKTWDKGYVIHASKEISPVSRQIVQLKLDSASNAATCITRLQQNFVPVWQSFPADTAAYVYTNLHALTNLTYNLSEITGVIDTAGVCREIYCPAIPLTDSCVDSYQKLYRTYDNRLVPNDLLIINGRTYVSGTVNPMMYYPNYSRMFIAEVSKNGQIGNQKKFFFSGFSNANYISGIHKGNDSSILVLGNTWDSARYPTVFLAKIDTGLSVQWIKTFRAGPNNGFLFGVRTSSLVQGSDGSIFILHTSGEYIEEQRVYLTKLDANGNYLWSKMFRRSLTGSTNYIEGKQMVIVGDNVFISCKHAYDDYAGNFLIKVSASTGAMLWEKKYTNPAPLIDISEGMTFSNNEIFMSGIYKDVGSSVYKCVLAKTDLDGNITGAITFRENPSQTYPRVNYMCTSGGNIVMGSGRYRHQTSSGLSQFTLTVNSALNIISIKNRPTLLTNEAYRMAVDGNGRWYETGIYNITNSFWNTLYVAKYTVNGTIGTCPSDSLLIQPEPASPITVTTANIIQADNNFVITALPYFVEQSFLATSAVLCASVPGCSSIDITGDTAVCDRTQSYTFRANRNNGCESPLQWISNNSNVQVLSQSDSTITVNFLNPGDVLLKASFTSNCTTFKDSLLIHVVGDRPALNLGRDTSLCPGSSLVLNARRGFRTYRWQDGSADSTFTVTATGLYYVIVTDSCNNTLSDSIQVEINTNGPILNLGPDSNFCQSNAILLQAQPGFLSYQWQDGSANAQFTATNAGTYYVSVTDSCGNIITDTIRLRSYRQASTLNLGRDTSLCNTVNVRLSAGPGFAQYQWQDGSADSLFTAVTTGLFYVQVKDSCGNIKRDSIRIYPDTAIVFDLGPDRSICRSDSLILQATPGLTNYSWSPQSSIFIQSPPTSAIVFPSSDNWYYVSAVKPNGCTVTDSVFITVHVPPPIDLGRDTSLCQGDTLLLNAGTGFQSYSWSTGQQVSSIDVYQVGTYIISAVDQNLCTSSDTLSVLQVYPLPVSQLPEESAICRDQSQLIHAGSGYPHYHWNTGENTESISVISLGYYWVTITSSNSCEVTDTIHINQEYLGPADLFSVKDSSICSFESILLSPSGSYQTYQWSNGLSTSSININAAGEYWLQVEDVNGCKATDTFQLNTKECNIGVFFPTSFTPNDDGLNDTYGPKAYGRLISYRMAIYNRFGEKVFETSNIRVGWNGKYKGYMQETGAYVWESVYQMEGKPLVKKSSSLLLIR